jgi:hypothetical protein
MAAVDLPRPSLLDFTSIFQLGGTAFLVLLHRSGIRLSCDTGKPYVDANGEVKKVQVWKVWEGWV